MGFNRTSYLDFSKKISKFLENDILPLGKEESLPTSIVYSDKPEDFSHVVRLFPLDSNSLMQNFKRTHLFLEEKYLSSREKIYSRYANKEECINFLTKLGFTKDKFMVLPLRDVGKTELCSQAGKPLISFLRDWPTDFFRPQYNISKEGWNSAYHIDHSSFKIHGFRVLVPLDNSINICFLNNKKEYYYVLEPGFSYFVNVGLLHRSFCKWNIRAALSFQMNTDKYIFDSNSVHPLDIEQIPVEYTKYEYDEKLWENH